MNNSKDLILDRIRKAGASHTPLPALTYFEQGFDLVTLIKESLIKNGAQVSESKKSDLNSFIHQKLNSAQKVFSVLPEWSGNIKVTESSDPRLLDDVEVAILKAEFGVAETGALWIDSTGFILPVIPFIVQHLVIILDQKDLVENMHQAYGKIDIRKQNFGLFIAGPSKTADIEQSLVIGAHGSLSLTVCLTTD